MFYKRRIHKNIALKSGDRCILIHSDGFPAGMVVTVLEPKSDRKGHFVKVKNDSDVKRRVHSKYLEREDEI